jgi:hypothetical protein
MVSYSFVGHGNSAVGLDYVEGAATNFVNHGVGSRFECWIVCEEREEVVMDEKLCVFGVTEAALGED